MKMKWGLWWLLGALSPAVGEVFDEIEVGGSPEWHFETEIHADGSRSQHFVFETVAGVDYLVETSGDLQSWEAAEEDRWYGLGHEIVVPMVQTLPPPDPPDPPDPPADPPPPTVHASLVMRPAASGGGLVLSWRSLDDGGPAVHHFPLLTMAAAWDSVPLFAATHGGHDFFITHPTTMVEPPSENPLHAEADAAMLADFETHFPAMNQSVIDAEAQARLNPPPAPPSEGARKFWRIKADWGLDTDGDGSADWFEHAALAEYAAQVAAGNTPSGPQPDPMSADSDGNGVPDSMESDADDDGVMDWEDPVPGEPLIDWKRSRAVRYSFHPLPVDPPAYDPGGLRQIDGVGRVLFQERVWSGGVFTDLPGAQHGYGLSMNEQGMIVGYFYDGTEAGMACWKNGWSSPVIMKSGNYTAWPSYALSYGAFAFGSVFDDDGRVVAETWEDTGGPGLTFRGRDVWKLNANGVVSGRSSTGPNMEHTHAPEAFFGPDSSYSGTEYGHAGWSVVIPGRAFDRAVWMPAPSARRMLTGGGAGSMFFNGISSFVDAPAGLAAVRDFAAQTGVGIMSADVSGSEGGTSLTGAGLWQNGEARPIQAFVTDLPSEWQADMELLDSSNSGAILAGRNENGVRVQGTVLFPLGVEDNEFAAGVDDFSASCTHRESSVGWQDRVWVMAPAGGSTYTNDTILHVPCDSLDPVTISVHGLGALAPSPAIVTSSGQPVSWVCAGHGERGWSLHDQGGEFGRQQ